MNITSIVLQDFNPRRSMRNAPAASFELVEDGETYFLWMREIDIKKNIMQFPEFREELQKGLDAYREQSKQQSATRA